MRQAIEAHRDGEIGRWVLDVYAHKLGQQILQFRQGLKLFQIPPGAKSPAAAALEQMAAQVEEFQFIVDHLNMFVSSGDSRCLDLVEQSLGETMESWPAFVGKVKVDIQAPPPPLPDP